MGLLKKLTNRFGKNNQEIEEVEYNPELEDTGLKREDVDMHDKKQRENYVKACLEQLAEASKELETLGYEYNLVTSYLTDMEEIDAMEPEIRGKLSEYAKKIVELDGDQKEMQTKRKVMSEDRERAPVFPYFSLNT